MGAFEQLRIELLFRLHGVTTVDEHDSTVAKNHQRSGRAGKAGEPRQPLARAGDVFVSMLVGKRNDKAIQTERGQRRLEPLQPIGDGLGWVCAPLVEGSEAVPEKIAQVSGIGRSNEIQPGVGIKALGGGEDAYQDVVDLADRFLDAVRRERLCQPTVIRRRHNPPPMNSDPRGQQQASQPQGWQPYLAGAMIMIIWRPSMRGNCSILTVSPTSSRTRFRTFMAMS